MCDLLLMCAGLVPVEVNRRSEGTNYVTVLASMSGWTVAETLNRLDSAYGRKPHKVTFLKETPAPQRRRAACFGRLAYAALRGRKIS